MPSRSAKDSELTRKVLCEGRRFTNIQYFLNYKETAHSPSLTWTHCTRSEKEHLHTTVLCNKLHVTLNDVGRNQCNILTFSASLCFGSAAFVTFMVMSHSLIPRDLLHPASVTFCSLSRRLPFTGHLAACLYVALFVDWLFCSWIKWDLNTVWKGVCMKTANVSNICYYVLDHAV